MNKIFYLFLTLSLLCTAAITVEAGNPDRQGEAGAYELLMIPYAKMAGLHAMNTSFVTGVEAMRLNVAGLSRVNKTEVEVGYARYLQGTDINMNAFGFAQKVGNGAFGFSLMALDFGDIPVTTTEQPEGTGATYSPNFFNLALSYAVTFENKVSVGITLRGISESTSNVSAFGFALDAGVQYVSGEHDNFKFGISLRNVGSRMTFNGEGLGTRGPSPTGAYELTFEQRTAGFELPSMLNIGTSYDILFGANRVTLLGNFTSNSFSRDQVGGGLEYALNEIFMLRAGYKYEFQSNSDVIQESIYTGLAGGLTVQVPLKKKSELKEGDYMPTLGIDYAYRETRLWDGTHNISVRISL
ncbi:MAG: hypothetical protein DHS20C17_24470 [Cyclobacteriaceae bacterium]|nr:MAG: hypothetical protein DHS20C17_24470 [Cyclobacteriaceae bacterium]